ncbi:hypothetical protein D5086_031664, partial [Populus alba]
QEHDLIHDLGAWLLWVVYCASLTFHLLENLQGALLLIAEDVFDKRAEVFRRFPAAARCPSSLPLTSASWAVAPAASSG